LTKDKLHTLNLKIIPPSNLARIPEYPGMIKALMKILWNSVAIGHLMIKAIQLVKARTRTTIMKMIK
jgi:hypothetical protein